MPLDALVPGEPADTSPARPKAHQAQPGARLATGIRMRMHAHDQKGPSFKFTSEVVLDVYAMTREKFRVPPVDGLDADAFRPIGRHEKPERFGRNILPPNGIPDPSPEVLDRLLHANYAYRIRVAVEEPKDLSYLARTLTTAASLCQAVDGVIRDVHTHLVLTHEEARRVLKSPNFSINDHVLVHMLQDPDAQGVWLHTHGMAKFGRPDLEMRAVPDHYQALASHGLLTIADYLSQGHTLRPGETMQLGSAFLTFVLAAANRIESFPNGIIRVTDFDPASQAPAVGVLRWLTEVMN